MRWRSSLKVAFRLGMRQAVRYRMFSWLATLLIALPISAMVALASIQWTSTSLHTAMSAWLGADQSVQALTAFSGFSRVQQDLLGEYITSNEVGPETSVPLDKLEQWVPEGDQLKPVDSFFTVALGTQQTQTGGAESAQSGTQSGAVAMWQAPEAGVAMASYPATAGSSVDGVTPQTGEAVVSTDVMEALGLSIGDQVTIELTLTDTGNTNISQQINQSVTVAGSSQAQELMVVGPDTINIDRSRVWDSASTMWYITGDQPISWQKVKELNAHGFSVSSRDAVDNPPTRSELYHGITQAGSTLIPDSAPAPWMIVVGTLVTIAEMVLIVSPVFTVAGRRDVTTLAMVSAVGGEPADQRRVLFSFAAIIGFGAGVISVALGYIIALVICVKINHFDYAAIPPVVIPVAVVLGVLLAVLAAAWPARAASRLDVVRVLSRRPVRTSWLVKRNALFPGLVGIGLLLQCVGAWQHQIPAVVLGGLATIVGLIGCLPWLLNLVGKISDRGGLAFRFALRDALRQGHRTAPALSAVISAIFLVAALLVNMASSSQATWDSRVHLGRQGQILVSAMDMTAPASSQQASQKRMLQAITTRVGVEGQAALMGMSTSSGVWGPPVGVDAVIPADKRCPLASTLRGQELVGADAINLPDVGADVVTNDQTRRYQNDPRCSWYFRASSTVLDWDTAVGIFPTYLVDDGSFLQMAELADANQIAVLQEGGVLVPDSRAISQGLAQLRVLNLVQNDASPHYSSTQPTVDPATTALGTFKAAVWNKLNLVVLSPQVAETLDVPVLPLGTLIQPQQKVSALRAQSLEQTLSRDVADAQVSVIVPQTRSVIAPYLVVLVALIILVCTVAVVVALANADTRPDLDTLEAIGASPGLRRRITICQGLMLGLLGLPAGMALGVMTGALSVLARCANSGTDLAALVLEPQVPWLALGLLLLGLIALSALMGALLTPKRRKISRRIW